VQALPPLRSVLADVAILAASGYGVGRTDRERSQCS